MTFDRARPFFGKTLAWRLFKRHHTHFNDIYWANRAAAICTYSCTRPYKTTDPASALLSLPGNEQRLAATLGEWATHYSAFNQWTQMASIVAICGYLETYIAQVATAALESSPAIVFGGTKEIDGTVLLKAGNQYDFYAHTEPLVRGDWQSRISAYSRLFGTCPLEGHLSDLEKLRRHRNDAGHSFGRDIKSMRFVESSSVQSLPRLSDENIQGYLDLAKKVAAAIEAHVGSQFVGAYEVLRLFHAWRIRQSSLSLSPRHAARGFSTYFYDVTGNSYGVKSFVGLEAYYDAL